MHAHIHFKHKYSETKRQQQQRETKWEKKRASTKRSTIKHEKIYIKNPGSEREKFLCGFLKHRKIDRNIRKNVVDATAAG